MLDNTPAAEGLVTPATEEQPNEPILDLDSEQPVEITDEASEQEEQAEEQETTEPEAEADEPEAEGDEEQPALEEIEFNGKKYSIPAELKANFMMQADYTRKTQEVAEIRKEAEAEREKAVAVFNSSQEYIQANAALMNVDNQLKQYENVNWNQLEQEDPIAAMSHWRQFQQLQGQRQQVVQYLQSQQAERSQRMEQDTANRLRQTREFAEKEIPGWNVELDNEVTKFAVDSGFTPEQLRAAMSPQIYKMLHLASLGAKVMQQQQSAQKPAPKAPPKPLTKVTAKASPAVSKSPEDMSAAEYAAWRKTPEGKRF